MLEHLHNPQKDASKTKATVWCKHHGHHNHETKDYYPEKERKGRCERKQTRECPRSDGMRRDSGGGKMNLHTIRKEEEDTDKKKRNTRERSANAVVVVTPHPMPRSALRMTVHLKKEALATSQSKANDTTTN